MQRTEFISVELNSNKKISNIQRNHGPVKYVLKEKYMIPNGWNIKREASDNKYDNGAIGNTQHNHGPSSGQFFLNFSYILKNLTFFVGKVNSLLF